MTTFRKSVNEGFILSKKLVWYSELEGIHFGDLSCICIRYSF